MSRINGITRGGSLIAQIVFFFSKRKVKDIFSGFPIYFV